MIEKFINKFDNEIVYFPINLTTISNIIKSYYNRYKLLIINSFKYVKIYQKK